MAHIFKSGAQEAGAGELLQVQDQPGLRSKHVPSQTMLHSETISDR